MFVDPLKFTDEELSKMFDILRDYDKAISFLKRLATVAGEQEPQAGVLMKRALHTVENKVNTLLFDLELRGPGV
jgi:hypothetical protein